MRFLLVDPPFHRCMGMYRYYFPLGLTSLAAVLKQSGHEAYVYDAEIDPLCHSSSVLEVSENHSLYSEVLLDDNHDIWHEYRKILNDMQPDVVGFSALTVKLAAVTKMISITKENSNAIIIAGGEHVTVRPHDVLSKGADCVVLGEGERSIVRLAEKIGNGHPIPQIIDSPLIENLDTLPLPAIESLLNINGYRPLDLGLMMTERGCPYGCTFCGLASIWGHKVRYHSVKRVIDEIGMRKEKYGTSYFSFRNGTFTVNRDRTIDLCRCMLDSGLNIQWECLTRVDAVDFELLQLMKQSGCVTIRVGIESGSESLLRQMCKGISLHKIREAAELLHKSNIFWSAYFMIGVPGETEETIADTMSLIDEIDPPFVTLARFTPLPGTQMYNEVLDMNLLSEDENDWTWANNQSFSRSFTKNIEQGRFSEIAKMATEIVNEHNKKHASAFKDYRMK